jgi:cytoskeletal protein CcmA (bactofilin family)
MFNSKIQDNTNMTTQPQPGSAQFNALTAGSKIIGTVIADNDIHVDGTIEGEIKCTGKVVIGENGFVKGTITCQNADIQGKLDGKIDVKQTLSLRASAHLQAEVNTQVLIVEPNAVFNGTCNMGKSVAQPQPQPAQPK